MRKIIIVILCLLVSTPYAAETDCHGKWENDETVRIKINWTTETVKVNDIHLTIAGTTESKEGIATSSFTNKFDQESYFSIGNFGTYDHKAVFIIQVFPGFFSNTYTKSTSLTCTKSFNTPFKEKMTQPL